ncbi:MAG: MOFRL family protein [Gemmatimonadota bacterium]
MIRIVGSGSRAVEAAAVRARDLGYRTHILSRKLEGEARNAGRALARVGMAVQDGVAGPAPPACILASGETTVRVTGSGLGGRNQEVALGAALALEGRSGIVVASLGTDGVDGPTDAAGGLADGSSVERARAMGRSVADALERNDAYPVLDALGDLVRTGVTGTNVADLMVVLVRPS